MLFLIPAASASEFVFGSWVYGNTAYKTSSGLNFSVSPNDDSSKLAFSFQKGGGAIVEKEECESSAGMIICYEDFAFSHYNYSMPGRIVNKYKVSIEAEVASVNFTRTFSTLSPEVGEQVSVSSSFMNNGAATSEFYFEDSYPANFDVFLTSMKCEKSKNAVSWKGLLSPGQPASCSYIIKPMNSSGFTSIAFVEFDGKKKEIQNTIKVSDYSVKGILNISENLSMGLEYDLPIRLESVANVTVRYSVRLPDGLKLVSFKGKDWSGSGSLLEYSGSLASGTPATAVAGIRAEGAGLQGILENVSFRKSNSTLAYQKKTEVFIAHERPYVRAVPSGKAELHLFVVNPGLAIQNVTVYLDSNLSAGEAIISEVPGGGHRDFFVEGSGDIPWRIKYQTKYGTSLVSEGIIFLNGSEGHVEPVQPILQESDESYEAESNESHEEEQQVELVHRYKVPVLAIISPIALMLFAFFAFLLIRRHSQA